MGLLDRIFGRRRQPPIVCAVDPEIQAESKAIEERERRLRELEHEDRLSKLRRHDPDRRPD